MQKNNKILIATGGTGGHVFPALALKTALEKYNYQVIVTGDSKFSKFHSFDDKHIFIPSANFSNKSIFKIFSSAFTLLKGFLGALWLILNFNPSLVIGFGGYASYPAMLAAVLFRKKIILHEANTVLGKVNKAILPWANYLTCGFKELKNISAKEEHKIVFTGNPVREEIINSGKLKQKKQNETFSILIIGGSQGAKVFSKMMPDAIINLPTEIKKNIFVYQQVKEEDILQIEEKYKNENIPHEICSFFSNMNDMLNKVDLIIARAGASTIAEIIEFSLPAILIPYPSAADDHQLYNAKAIVDAQGGWLVKEDKNSHLQLIKIIKSIHQDKSVLSTYSNNLKSLHKDACANIIEIIAKVLKENLN